MKPRRSYKKWMGITLALSLGMLGLGAVSGYAEVAHFGIHLSDDKEPVELYANSLEIRDKEGIALFNGDVSVIQGEHLLRTAKLVVYYDKTRKEADKNQGNAKTALSTWFGSTGIKKMEALGKVYIKIATQIATGDKGVYDGKSKMMSLTGKNVVLTNGDNVATGCKLTADMKSGKAFLEGCKTSEKKGRVSIIFKQSQKNSH
ncbi:LptA/OstA family protein [Bartonella henselae]|uniref:LptA/OstA family protein n=1 Tax=Bartonella henselae TaxID=38323 RepID=UPI0003DF8DD2|nr:LptA/OstA family protein [Bartonella henselae]ETS09637.1 lipopolysaccharide transport periplasmic protein LptA [Bartonella henselae JK 42]ETS12665.1 lipopolysaccharide transport periplasmic protein LptA [Bartonella henselae JK 41]KEC58421.1 lipopolysaccharide transport periplasmic protein LptA [Bartonella henselae str. Zeus]KEC61192.1 lipopolysaccharide transport periplasmic protein LptA [Bartonella henselae JK 53]MDM9983127.1 LptA/OstA family protein [Bartonella henselae]